MEHIPVLLREVIEGLEPKPGDTVFDGTLGGGGHAEALCSAIGESGLLIGTDEDEGAVRRVAKRLESAPCRQRYARSNFRKLDEVLGSEGIASIDKIILDLGLSSFQLEESGRGFSFKGDEPLRMTFAEVGEEGALTAEEIVNEWSEETLADIIFYYGGERFGRRIARGIVEARTEKPITRTSELVGIVERVTPSRYQRGRIHPATKTFQALRTATNDEIEALREGLAKGFDHLRRGGRFAVISFHELEDRVVKHFFKHKAQNGEATLITKKPITPARDEVAANPRARSAKLRITEKCAHLT